MDPNRPVKAKSGMLPKSLQRPPLHTTRKLGATNTTTTSTLHGTGASGGSAAPGSDGLTVTTGGTSAHSTVKSTTPTTMPPGEYGPPMDLGMGDSCMLLVAPSTTAAGGNNNSFGSSEGEADSGTPVQRYLFVCGGCRFEANTPTNGLHCFDTWDKKWIQVVSSLVPTNSTPPVTGAAGGGVATPATTTTASLGATASFATSGSYVGSYPSTPATAGGASSTGTVLTSTSVLPTATLPLPMYGHCCYATGSTVWLIGGGNNQVLFKTVLTFTVDIVEVSTAVPAGAATTGARRQTSPTPQGGVAPVKLVTRQVALVRGMTTYPLQHASFLGATCQITLTGRHSNYVFVVGGMTHGLLQHHENTTTPKSSTAAFGSPGPGGTINTSINSVGGTTSVTGGATMAYTNRCFALDLDDIALKNVVQTGDVPNPRAGAAVCALGENRLVLYGGRDRTAVLDDLYIGTVHTDAYLMTITVQWTRVARRSVAEIWPGPRVGHDLTVCGPGGSQVILTGGSKIPQKMSPLSNSKMFILCATGGSMADFGWSELGFAAARNFHRTFAITSSTSNPCCAPDPEAKKKKSADPKSMSSVEGDPFLFVCGSSSNPIRYANIDLNSRVVSTVPPQLVRFSLTFGHSLATPSPKVEVEFTLEKHPAQPTDATADKKDSNVAGAKPPPKNALTLESLKKRAFQEFLNKRSATTTDAPPPAFEDLLLEYDCPCTNERKPLHITFVLEEAIQACTSSAPSPPPTAGGATSASSSVPHAPTAHLTIHATVDVPPSNYIKMKQLGKGSFGEVFMALNQKDSSLFALKTVKVVGAASLETLRKEIRMMRQLRHDNIVQYLGSKLEGDEMHIFMDFVAGGDTLEKFCRSVTLPIRQVQMYIRQLLHALEFLHRYRIVHRDIKGANVLLSVGGVVKLSDFGTAKHLNPGSLNNQSNAAAGTMVFMAPEVMRSQECTEAADIWSLGCLVVELVAGAFPYEEMAFQDPLQVIHHVALASNPPKFPDRLPSAGVSFLKRCFQTEPAKRPSAAALLQDPFVTQLEAEGVVTQQPPPASTIGKTHYGGGSTVGAGGAVAQKAKGISTTQLFASHQRTDQHSPPASVGATPSSYKPPAIPPLATDRVAASHAGSTAHNSEGSVGPTTSAGARGSTLGTRPSKLHSKRPTERSGAAASKSSSSNNSGVSLSTATNSSGHSKGSLHARESVSPKPRSAGDHSLRKN